MVAETFLIDYTIRARRKAHKAHRCLNTFMGDNGRHCIARKQQINKKKYRKGIEQNVTSI